MTPLTENNANHRLCDWYIAPKYKDFKDEILHNSCLKEPIILTEFNEQRNIAILEYDGLKEKIVSIRCGRNRFQSEIVKKFYEAWDRLYGIRVGDKIQISHLHALLFYTIQN